VDAAGVRAICAFPKARLGLDRDAFVYDPRMSTMRWERGRA
jgi:hypothetical protein